jgi:cell division septation protein DedD
LASHAQDDGFHEIQLSGKQLVFLFMAVTVVSVVIFLTGVLVGRNVRAERSTPVADAGVTTEPLPPPQAAPPAPAAGSDPTAATPPQPVSDLSYPTRLENTGPAKEELKAPGQEKAAPRLPADKAVPEKKASPQNVTQERSAPVPAADVPKAPPVTASTAADAVFTVQIAALNARAEADSIASRLASKGYPAYVVPPGNGVVMYRVRVGHFKTSHEAEPMAKRLQKEEQFKPWITR